MLFFQPRSYDVVTNLVPDASESEDQISEISKVKIQGQGYLEIIYKN